jgi:hypothetical protein
LHRYVRESNAINLPAPQVNQPASRSLEESP